MDNHNLGNEGELNSELEVTDSTHLKPEGNQSWSDVIKKNLFNNWQNTLLTLVTGAFVIYLLTNIFLFLIANDWDVVYNNFRQLMIGRYPLEEVWRIWIGLFYLSFLIGLTYGIWKGAGKAVAFTFGTVYAVFAVTFFFGGITINTTLLLIGAICTIFVGYVLGHFVPKLAIPTLVAWALFIPITLGLLQGFWGLFPAVRSNYWGGFLLTVVLAMIAIVGCFPLGILLALGRRSKMPAIKYFCVFYIEIIRGMPLIMVLFIGRVFIPLFLGGVNIELVIRAMWAYTFFAAAYLAENVRGGLQSIPSGQYEAAHALGLNHLTTTALIILPQALKAVIPALVGQFITIFKDTSLVAIIGMADFLGSAQQIRANPNYLGRHMELYAFVAAFYFLFCYLMAYISRYMERSLSKSNH
jgi:general L-amino acid transport system permease protein